MQNAKGDWRVEVKNAYYGHNHEVSKAVYRGYPNVRKVPDDAPIMRDVELMVASGSKPSRVYDYIRTHTPHEVQMQDVYNMFAKLKKCGTTLSDEDQVAELLVKFNLEGHGNVSTVDENSRKQTAVVSIASQHMRKLYKRFPELLLIDCTHKTNRCNYQLCTIMVMDQFGNGQAVQHSVVARNAD
ncbi:hypothetical protein PR003_g16681 [Phytophthora rubi]|uniref:ZSWIM1/3 RNaseH-like domain-containing protein n=1 Tax=Phytophthora rubi TaxID=129364 RepID=A0A6A4EML7_9STRA|nr:hypothetical protein PR003_g16681 [Phytophthora rubi]